MPKPIYLTLVQSSLFKSNKEFLHCDQPMEVNSTHRNMPRKYNKKVIAIKRYHWVRIHGLANNTCYNGRVGLVMKFQETSAEVKLFGSDKRLSVMLKNLKPFHLQFSYTSNKPKIIDVENSMALKGSKYSRLVEFLNKPTLPL